MVSVLVSSAFSGRVHGFDEQAAVIDPADDIVYPRPSRQNGRLTIRTPDTNGEYNRLCAVVDRFERFGKIAALSRPSHPDGRAGGWTIVIDRASNDF